MKLFQRGKAAYKYVEIAIWSWREDKKSSLAKTSHVIASKLIPKHTDD